MRTPLSLSLLLVAVCATGRPAPTQDRGALVPNSIGNVRYGLGKVDFEVPGGEADANGALFGLALDAGTETGWGGGFRLDVYVSDDDLLGPGFTSSQVLGAEFFPHFTFRPTTGDNFRIPIRIGPYGQLHSLDTETPSNDLTISYLSIGAQFEVEPEVDFLRNDRMAFGIYGRLRFGGAWATIDDDITSEDYDTRSINFGAELGLRFQYTKFLFGTGYMLRSTTYDESDAVLSNTIPETDFQFEGVFFDFGVRW